MVRHNNRILKMQLHLFRFPYIRMPAILNDHQETDADFPELEVPLDMFSHLQAPAMCFPEVRL